jgi:hypothetical protein
MTFVRPLGMILPCAVATISTLPMQAQPNARTNTAMIVAPMARPIGDGGVSTISSAAGKKASSWSRRRRASASVKATTALGDFIVPARTNLDILHHGAFPRRYQS